MKGCTYDLKTWATNETQSVAYAIFKGTHNGKGPCEPTGKSTVSDYVYVMTVTNGKVSSVVKIWNAMWSARELGWA
jgi:ketosteroid isomerase-like protein